MAWMVDTDHGSVVASFRPTVSTVLGMDRERARTVLIVGAQIVLLLVVLSRLATGSWEVPIGVLLVAIVLAALVGWIWLYLANSSVVLTDSHLLITDWRASTMAVARKDVARLVRVGIRPFEGPPRLAVIGVDSADRGLFTLGAAYDVAGIAQSLSVTLSGSYDDVMSLRDMNRKYSTGSRGVLADSQRLFLVALVGALVIGVIAFVFWTATRS